MDDTVFNLEIEVDVMWIDMDRVLRINNRGKRYSVANFKVNQRAEHPWDIIVEFWISVCTGYPEIISHDQGKNFTAVFFQHTCSQLGITTRETPVESQNYLPLCERYHSIICRVHKKLKVDFPPMGKQVRFSTAVHAIDTTMGPEGLTLCLLLFAAVPRSPVLNLETMAPTQEQPFEAIGAARKEMETFTAQRRVRTALKHGTGIQPVPNYEFGVWREETKTNEGSFIVHS